MIPEQLDDGEKGELIPEPTLGADHSEIRPGDRIIFKYHHRAFLPRGWSELAGVVLRVMPGFQLTYLVAVATSGILPWPDLFVERRNILKVLL